MDGLSVSPRGAGRRFALLAVAMLGLAACQRSPGPPQAQPLDAAQLAAGQALSVALADRFQATLQARLQAAMAERGVAGAIDTCAIEAPAIAASLSRGSGATVRRTSLRNRNPNALPDAFERVTMEAWARAPLDAEGRPRARVEADGTGGLRFMRAIPTREACLACHGPADALAPDVLAVLAARYPEDRATGFAPGELRGAFSIRWSAEALRAALDREDRAGTSASRDGRGG